MRTPPVFVVLFTSGDPYDGDRERFVGVAADREAAEKIAVSYMKKWGGDRWKKRKGLGVVSWFGIRDGDTLSVFRETPKKTRRKP